MTSNVFHVIANLDAVQYAAIASAIILSVYQNVMVARAAQTSLLNLNKIVKMIYSRNRVMKKKYDKNSNLDHKCKTNPQQDLRWKIIVSIQNEDQDHTSVAQG